MAPVVTQLSVVQKLTTLWLTKRMQQLWPVGQSSRPSQGRSNVQGPASAPALTQLLPNGLFMLKQQVWPGSWQSLPIEPAPQNTLPSLTGVAKSPASLNWLPAASTGGGESGGRESAGRSAPASPAGASGLWAPVSSPQP